MAQDILLFDIFYYFVVTTMCVPFFKVLGLGGVIGYLVAGIFLGPSGLNLLHHADNIQEISQIGIIILLFVIGLELSPARLKHLHKTILGLGTFQFLVTVFIFWGICRIMGVNNTGSLLIACAFSLSSTAFSLTYLKDTDQITKSYGQSSFSILIFQDLIVIPLLTIIPLITGDGTLREQLGFVEIAKNLLIVACCILGGKFALRPALSIVYKSQSKEIFIGTCLMIVLGSSLLMEQVGLSKALGAFVAGIFLSDSNFRTEIQTFSITLKSMLMGVFFMGIGLAFDLEFFYKHISTVLILTTSFMSFKFLILLGMGKVVHKSWHSGFKMAGALCQGGEFGFLLIGISTTSSVFSPELTGLLTSSIALSIFLAPLIVKTTDYFSVKFHKPMPIKETIVLPEHETENVIEFPDKKNDNETNTRTNNAA